jgi:hypothetical protein
MPDQPPMNFPIYRILTGRDDADFCHRVSEAIELGYELYGSPCITSDGEFCVVAQALTWRSASAATAGPQKDGP